MHSAAALWEPWIPYALCQSTSVQNSRFYLCGYQELPMLFHGRQNAQISLYTTVVVVINVGSNHVHECFLAGEMSSIVPFPFQNPPESLHGTIINAVGNAGHTLGHPGSFQLGVECAIRVLKSSVTMEQRMGIRIGLYRFVKGLEYQRVVITFAQNIGCNTPVI